MTKPEQKTNGGYVSAVPDEVETMPPARRDEFDDVLRALERLADDANKKAAKDELLDAQNREVMHRLANALEDGKKKNGNGNWIQYGISLALVIAGWVYSGVYVAKTTETEIRVSNAIISERLETVRSEYTEFRKETAMKLALADERFRQISIAIEAKGIRLPRQ